MNIVLIYLTCININVGEALPRIFLNGVYTNTNNLDKYYVNTNNNAQEVRFIEVGKDAIAFNECTKLATREECLRRLKRKPAKYIRRLSKHYPQVDRENIRETPKDPETQGFSQDYLDINDLLLRTNSDATLKNPSSKHKPRKSQIYKILKSNKFDRFAFDLTTFRRNNRKKKASESDESDSSSSESRERIPINKVAKNKRFQIVDKSTESESSEEVRVVKKKPNKKKKDRLMYMQSPTRVYDGRRRLQHFLPKRYFWNIHDIRELDNYWYNGPRGKTW